MNTATAQVMMAHQSGSHYRGRSRGPGNADRDQTMRKCARNRLRNRGMSLVEAQTAADGWARALVGIWPNLQTKAAREPHDRALSALLASAELRAALEAAYRMGGTAAAREVVRPFANPPLTEDQREARRLTGVKNRQARLAQHAATQLAEHDKALRREQRLVKKWRAKVRYYEKLGLYPDQDPK